MNPCARNDHGIIAVMSVNKKKYTIIPRPLISKGVHRHCCLSDMEIFV